MGVRKVFQGIPVGMEGFGYKSGPKHQCRDLSSRQAGSEVRRGSPHTPSATLGTLFSFDSISHLCRLFSLF